MPRINRRWAPKTLKADLTRHDLGESGRERERDTETERKRVGERTNECEIYREIDTQPESQTARLRDEA